MSALEDKADVARVLGGDVEAFEGVVRRWQGPMINLAFRYCRNQGEAEELAQEAFVRAFRMLHRWREEAAFSTWLFTVASNLFRSHLRRRIPTSVTLDAVGEVGDGRPFDGGLEQRDAERDLRRKVLLLPEKYRDALILFYFQGQDIAEAARILEVPEGTLKARLSRGRDLLRARLGKALSPLPQEA